MKQEYVTLWSKSINSPYWSLERTHTKEYAAVIMQSAVMDEIIELNGRHYIVLDEGIDANTLFHYEMLDNL